MDDSYDLRRFVAAQAPVIDAVMAELRAGRKRSHWMWFVFPQLAGLGSSPTARHYAIASRAEAAAYRAHPVLGARLLACTGLVNAGPEGDAHRLFGSPDDMKFHSCMTLFAALGSTASAEPATPENPGAFTAALQRFFGGRPDARTLALLDGL
ncbi:MAG: DUF1810 domain-containing protein [Janthinobacterium lividum]